MIILDGGMGRQLKQMGAPFGQPEWSALSLIENPQWVKQAHQQFIQAGADIITTNSYAIIPFHLGEKRYQEQVDSLLKLSATMALEARSEQTNDKVQIAASIPPLFGSYQPELFDNKKAIPMLQKFAEHLLPVSDIILLETLSTIDEIQTNLNFFNQYKKPLWLSLTLMDEEDLKNTLRSGEHLEQALETIDYSANIEALLFNCSQPEVMQSAIEFTKKFIDKKVSKTIKLGVYANAFTKFKKSYRGANQTVQQIRDDLSPNKYLEFAKIWQNLGAEIIGGCCGIGIEHIKTLDQYFKKIKQKES